MIKSWIIARAKEPTTYLAIGLGVIAATIVHEPVMQVILLIAAGAGFVLAEKGKI